MRQEMSGSPQHAQPLSIDPVDGDDAPGVVRLDAWTQPRAADGSYVAIARESLASLTSLRFFAAAYVVLHHLVNMGLLHQQGADADRQATWYLALATQGHVGVTFFFVLSGFILAWCYHAAFARSSDDPAPVRAERRNKFWFARFARVWPLHAVMFALFVPITLLGALDAAGLVRTAWTGILNLSLLQAWIPFGGPDGIADTFNAPSWTLSCEAFFYLAFPLLATLLVAKLRWGIAQLALVTGAAWLALGGIVLAVQGMGMADWAVAKFPPTRFVDFVIGVCAGLIVVQLRQRGVLRGAARPTRATQRGTIVELLVIAAALAGPVFVALTRGDLLPENLTVSWLHLPAFTALIVVMSLERGAISRTLLAWKPLIWLGEVSYALYLTHMFFVLLAYRAGVYDILGTWTTSLLLFAIALVASGIVHERFEKPARAWLVARRTARPAA